MIKMGIDPSINNTGICVWEEGKKENIYYSIPSKITKKVESFSHNFIYIYKYDKKDPKGLEYSDKESIKFSNIYKICEKISYIIDKHKPDIIYMEGVSYGSLGSAALVDLCFLNSAIRMELMRKNIPFIIVSPTSLKKFACANGQAEKDIIIDAWKRMDGNISNVKDIKIDDLADSFFLAHYDSDSQ